MRTLVLFVALLISTGTIATAQNTQSEFVKSKQVGLTYSTIGGYGIHFIFPDSERDNFKITGIYVFDDSNGETDSFFSLGGEYQRDLLEDELKRVFFLAGLHVDNRISENTFFNYSRDKESFVSIGGGLGADFGSTSKGLVLNAHLTYQYTGGLNDTHRRRLGLGGGIGIGFNFKP